MMLQMSRTRDGAVKLTVLRAGMSEQMPSRH